VKLELLKLENFRRFDALEIDFHPKLTVIIAENGQGKTSILDAATITLGTYVGAFGLGKDKRIDVKDARYLRLNNSPENEQQFPVRLTAKLSNLTKSVTRELKGTKNKTTIVDASELTGFGKQLKDDVQQLKETNLPLLAYYGTGRLWKNHKNVSRKAVLSESRSMGYEDCFSSASSFTQVQQWMLKAAFASWQQDGMSGYENSPLPEQVKGIKQAVEAVLACEGWGDFHYSVAHEELAMRHQSLGVLPVAFLSDGVRAMVAMVADIAWRCAKLNPHLGVHAQAEAEGVVFIDEVDIHLHPKWQQTVIASLTTVFPKIQFIVTTHSSLVLSTVPRECIRAIGENTYGEAVASIPISPSYGQPSGDILRGIMKVDSQPPIAEKEDLQTLTSLVDQGQYQSETVQDLLGLLSDKLGAQHPQLERVRRSIRRQEYLKDAEG